VVSTDAHTTDKNLSLLSHTLIIKKIKEKVKGDGKDMKKST
jgi:hypothetical protein